MSTMAKDLHRLMRQLGKLTDGQASICDLEWCEGEIDSFKFVITPNSGLYQGGTFKFVVMFPGEYVDDNPPMVICQTDIYHPNIDTTASEDGYDDSNVCLNILDRGTWNRKFGLEFLVLGLLHLLHYPNLESPLTPGFDSLNNDTFQNNVKKYMRGEKVAGRTFSADFKHPEISEGSDHGDAKANTEGWT